jgi:hypothetical protein
MIDVWLLAITLVILAGLNAPLGMWALALVTTAPLILRPELTWLVSPTMMWLWSGLLVFQFLADLYFVPATVKDVTYLHRARTANAYLHARLQSFLRPLAAALVLAAIPSELSAQTAAVGGFVCGTAIYWSMAWVREQVAISRGSVILLVIEMAKNVVALVATAVVALLAPLAFALLAGWLSLMAVWAARLRREQLLYPAYGGAIVPEDS